MSHNATYGQVNTVDLGYYNYSHFTLVGGTEELATWNISKRNKGANISVSTSSVGAATASKIHPKQDLIAYATGTDWCKGMYEL